MSCKELLERIVSALSYEGRMVLENVIMDALDHVTMENAMDTAGMMCGINSVPSEARWHAAESFCGAENLLCNICTDQEIHSRLSNIFMERYIKDGNEETLKRLFAKMFENDRAVCAEIQTCLELL